jgi:D-beta-D-heptose 7-phosphate kinase/D-beta-D-heptose 1-phosphate adenosyltransferase
VLAALAAVDCVVLFDEDTPLALIRLLRPDVLVKGADYARDAIVGANEVEGWGGRVVRVPLVSDKSTTTLLERLRGEGKGRR